MYRALFKKKFLDCLLKCKIDNLAIAEGCAFNFVTNIKMITNKPFKKLFLQSAVGDAGRAIVAALEICHRIIKKKPVNKVRLTIMLIGVQVLATNIIKTY
jgi:predicted NodU family carbamoyl transferase